MTKGGESVGGEGSAALVPEKIEVQPDAVDKAAPAARAAADRITQWFKRRPTAPHARAAAQLLRREAHEGEGGGEGRGDG